MSVVVRNPHSVLAALDTRPQDVVEVRFSRRPQSTDPEGDVWARVQNIARAKRVRIVDVKGDAKPARGPSEGGRVGGTEAVLKERDGVPAEVLFGQKDEQNNGLWLALDTLQDPHNVGAIFRAAAFFGVRGILLTQDRSAPLSGTVYDVASGGIEHVPFTQQTNLQRGFEIAKDSGLWILGTSEHAKESLFSIKADRPWLLVLGNEERGMRRLTEEACDQLCSIPARGSVGSLNVSVAAGIMIAHLAGIK